MWSFIKGVFSFIKSIFTFIAEALEALNSGLDSVNKELEEFNSDLRKSREQSDLDILLEESQTKRRAEHRAGSKGIIKSKKL